MCSTSVFPPIYLIRVCVCMSVSDTPFVHRIPEILLEGSDVWTTIEQEEDLEEIQRILQTFIFSVIMQRVHHLIMEVCVCVSLSLLLKTPTYKVKHASMYESAGCLGLKHKNGITRKGRITHLSLSHSSVGVGCYVLMHAREMVVGFTCCSRHLSPPHSYPAWSYHQGRPWQQNLSFEVSHTTHTHTHSTHILVTTSIHLMQVTSPLSLQGGLFPLLSSGHFLLYTLSWTNKVRPATAVRCGRFALALSTSERQ